MSDLESAASNAAPETAAPVIEAPAVETPSPRIETQDNPSTSAREALEKAFRQVSDQPREPDGKFASKDGVPVAPQISSAPATVDAQKAAEPAPAVDPANGKPAVEAPSRFAPAAKEAWAATPDPVKFEIDRALFEMGKGLEEYQAKFQPLKQFDEMARAAGKELPKVVAEYVNMENTLSQNPVAGVNLICKRLGIDPRQLGEALLSGFDPAPQPEAAPQTPEAIARLEQRVADMQAALAQQQTLAQIEAFSKDRPRFDELSPLMAEMLSTGFAKNLSDAYEKADRLQPPPPQPAPMPTIAVPTATPAPAPAQTQRPSAKQITGSPSGSNPNSRPPAGSSRDALKNAFASVGLT